ncbi:hypothetical protein [Curtobacterium sp. 458]|uniref:hypothetical protein n=1 Tax=Curtobacterium sp. 458 TaxID=3050069 RepID=UPI0025B55E40|nr:hypothetical protein [Curtobacterium sp. 458]WJY01090.1 hypothetical protein QPJ90_05185 [Curtobacterium sp. 458]
MGERRIVATVFGMLLAVGLVTGCAVGDEGARTAAHTATSTAPGAGPTADPGPTGAAGTYAPSGDGAGPGADSPPQYSLNKRHHERTELGEQAAAELAAVRAEALSGIAGLPAPVTLADVTEVLRTVGAADPWIVEYDGRVEFETQVEMSGCLVGTVQRDGTAEVSAAGWVLDGGCHAIDGH